MEGNITNNPTQPLHEYYKANFTKLTTHLMVPTPRVGLGTF